MVSQMYYNIIHNSLYVSILFLYCIHVLDLRNYVFVCYVCLWLCFCPVSVFFIKKKISENEHISIQHINIKAVFVHKMH